MSKICNEISLQFLNFIDGPFYLIKRRTSIINYELLLSPMDTIRLTYNFAKYWLNQMNLRWQNQGQTDIKWSIIGSLRISSNFMQIGIQLYNLAVFYHYNKLFLVRTWIIIWVCTQRQQKVNFYLDKKNRVFLNLSIGFSLNNLSQFSIQ